MRIDCHVHVVGTGTGGTGCWYRPCGFTQIGEPLLVRAVSLTKRDLHGPDFDRIYIDKLLGYVRGSTLIDRAFCWPTSCRTMTTARPCPGARRSMCRTVMSWNWPASTPNSSPRYRSIRRARTRSTNLETCLAGGAAALKCLPNVQGIDWNDRRHTRFLERMAEAGLPLLAHTGSERTMPVMDAKLASPRVLTLPPTPARA